ncbi:uncharacterized protein TRIADDRAFT_54065 [Trichoplax adhaerens]|uniref:CBF1-interacting co-repressor CIR N-terminal domain-containing protein n=1 Tax=Trichoplax adhaerens TaxID=10228 RepID=B3RR05_TRIAD|nr:hypothetical protein TRIADDRAFT_54065 [Trichoplax adhaerens]EDV26259.1 hypothetical protein TRIADDRAFT_54065 [Trichoplax adhaerens]|eukprot:XP_002110255.1 hypothetical protein TRIADDRAFT_54065 [Trichoplax adhaerens]
MPASHGFAKFMNNKDFHPGSQRNIKMVWMAEQRIAAKEKKEKELKEQYEKEQSLYKTREIISKDKEKLSVNFMYDAPPGLDKETKTTVKIFLCRNDAYRIHYAKDIAATDKPFGIAVRNVRCIKCGKWGHVNTDRECPLFNHTISVSAPSDQNEEASDEISPEKLMQAMRENGLTLKQSVLGRVVDNRAANQQMIESEEELIDDPEVNFLNSLTRKQKKKLLKKLDKLDKKAEGKSSEKKKKKKKKSKKSSSSSDEDSDRHYRSTQKKNKKSKANNLSGDSSSSDEETTKKSKASSAYRKDMRDDPIMLAEHRSKGTDSHRYRSRSRSPESERRKYSEQHRTSKTEKPHRSRRSRSRSRSTERFHDRSRGRSDYRNVDTSESRESRYNTHHRYRSSDKKSSGHHREHESKHY